MSCCGRGFGQQGHIARAAPRQAYAHRAVPLPARRNVPITFEYVGLGAIAVTGPLTGRTYRFVGKGARVTVHGADAPSMVSVPGLRPVR